MVYLIKQEARTGTYFKVGFTHSVNRFSQYITHNPSVRILETVATYRKTKHALETAIHREIKAQGYEFIKNYGIMTEWFFVPIAQEQEFERQGLKQFKACKHRQVIQWQG